MGSAQASLRSVSVRGVAEREPPLKCSFAPPHVKRHAPGEAVAWGNPAPPNTAPRPGPTYVKGLRNGGRPNKSNVWGVAASKPYSLARDDGAPAVTAHWGRNGWAAQELRGPSCCPSAIARPPRVSTQAHIGEYETAPLRVQRLKTACVPPALITETRGAGRCGGGPVPSLNRFCAVGSRICARPLHCLARCGFRKLIASLLRVVCPPRWPLGSLRLPTRTYGSSFMYARSFFGHPPPARARWMSPRPALSIVPHVRG